MISPTEARNIMLAHVERMRVEEVAAEACLGRTLAAPVVATRDQPPFYASAMDGYAVRSADTPGQLRLVGESGAGHALNRPLMAGECARIFTGAPLPTGADAVVIQENAARDGATVTVPAVTTGTYVRAPGLDFPAGATLLEQGIVLGAAALATAAAAGKDKLTVSRLPVLTILGGGDEIVAPGAIVRSDQIFDCASAGVAALAQSWGANSVRGPLLQDDAQMIASAIEAAWATSDLVVLVGGASVGDHDHARTAAAMLGAEVLFDKVSVRPGKPTWFALQGNRRILGLPGNPGSALVTARLFLRPIITAMLGGDVAATLCSQRARLTAPLGATGPREAYLRAKATIDETGGFCVTPASNQDSSLVSGFVTANALIVCPANHGPREMGALVDTISM
jgi:molybdopterin molybdotransferase